MDKVFVGGDFNEWIDWENKNWWDKIRELIEEKICSEIVNKWILTEENFESQRKIKNSREDESVPCFQVLLICIIKEKCYKLWNYFRGGKWRTFFLFWLQIDGGL